ncbi:hypothetical protein CHRYSEOSP005_11830 [Chryseobacterium sp. Alg-005]|uniref:hypothetical protein n=1 Tax=Chryseobacterium sp. Alg-005 TaxID=3159516 RepID=UPI00355583A8
MRAEISQSTLKLSNDEVIAEFTARLLSFINPKFESDAEAEIAEAEIYAFASKCELTPDEYFLALELAADKKLFSEPDENGNSSRIQLYREIDRLKLGEVKAAYIYHKTVDEQYKIGKNNIKAFLEPPETQHTPEQKKADRTKFYIAEYRRLQLEGGVLGTVIFYDLIKKRGLKTVKVGFIEAVLSTFVPEKTENIVRKDEPEKIKIPRVQKNDPLTYFKDCIVKAYIEKENLKEFTEEAWIEYWEKLHNQE